MKMVDQVFAPFQLPDGPVSEMNVNLHNSPERLLKFLITFHHKQSEPDCNQAYISATTLALGYFIGGFIPLIPYFCVNKVLVALYYSIGVMAITLFAFGYVKTCIVRGWGGRENFVAGIKGGIQMCLVGGLAAGAAVALVRVIDQTGKN
jgi:VIT1/CCC1 family predicted Fe2+/Mn2+ transporter